MNRKNFSISTGGEFAEQILAEFIAEAKDVAQGKGEYSSYEDIFGVEDDETSQPPSLV